MARCIEDPVTDAPKVMHDLGVGSEIYRCQRGFCYNSSTCAHSAFRDYYDARDVILNTGVRLCLSL